MSKNNTSDSADKRKNILSARFDDLKFSMRDPAQLTAVISVSVVVIMFIIIPLFTILKESVLSGKKFSLQAYTSIFKNALRGQYIVTHVYYRLQKTFHLNLTYAALRREVESRGLTEADVTAHQVRDIVVEVRRSKLPDPKEIGSAGSFFMNPIVSEVKFHELLNIYPEMPHYKMPAGVKVPAGWLIQQVGWKGKTLGRAGVYPKQALVLINLGGANGQDIVNLSNAIIHDVQQHFQIELKPEVNFI